MISLSVECLYNQTNGEEMKRNARFGLTSLLSGLTRAFELEGGFVSPLDGRDLTPEDVETEARGWENAYPIRFRESGESSAGDLVIRRKNRIFRLREAEWFGDQSGSGVILVSVSERRNGMDAPFLYTPLGLADFLLYDGVEEPPGRESVSRLLVSLGLSDGIAAPGDDGFWCRLPDVRFLERNVRENGGELPLRRICFLPGNGELSSPRSEPAFPVYDLSRTTRLIFESVRWDPRRELYVVRIATASVSGSVNREELSVGEIRERIGKIPGERSRLFRHWFTCPRV